MASISSEFPIAVKRDGISRSATMKISHDFNTEDIVLFFWNGRDEVEIKISKEDLQKFAILVDLLE